MDWQHAALLLGGAGGLASGLFGDSGAPYEDAMNEYKDWFNKAANYQEPYLEAGKAALPKVTNWLNTMENPSDFINNLMGKYQASPYSQYLQSQSLRAAKNAGSASGLVGSTPWLQQVQQNAGNIASGDLQSWLNRVLGINQLYGQGEENLVGRGQSSANALSNMASNYGQLMGEGAYGEGAGNNQDWNNLIGGGLSLGAGLLL